MSDMRVCVELFLVTTKFVTTDVASSFLACINNVKALGPDCSCVSVFQTVGQIGAIEFLANMLYTQYS